MVGGVSATKETPNTDIDPYYNEEGVLVITTVGNAPEDDSEDIDKDETTKVKLFKYPLGEIPDLGYDFIQITSFDYVPVGLPFGYGSDADVVTS